MRFHCFRLIEILSFVFRQITFVLSWYVCGLRLSPWRRCIAAWSFSASPHLATPPTTSRKVGWGIPAAFCDACGEESN